MIQPSRVRQRHTYATTEHQPFQPSGADRHADYCRRVNVLPAEEARAAVWNPARAPGIAEGTRNVGERAGFLRSRSCQPGHPRASGTRRTRPACREHPACRMGRRSCTCLCAGAARGVLSQALRELHVFDFVLALEQEHGLSQKAVEIARPFGFPITNSMVVTWIVAVGLIVFAQLATRKHDAGPERRAELAGVARRGPLRAAREHHRPRTWSSGRSGSSRPSSSSSSPPTGSASCRASARSGGAIRPTHGFAIDQPLLPRRQRRSQPDAGDGAGVLRLLDRLGAAGSRRRAACSRSCSRRRARRPGC